VESSSYLLMKDICNEVMPLICMIVARGRAVTVLRSLVRWRRCYSQDEQ